MKGKVFSSSQDLYQDQAKILFDFYKDAAEKIVSQEEEYFLRQPQRVIGACIGRSRSTA